MQEEARKRDHNKLGRELGLPPADEARLYHGTALEWLGLPHARFE